jgi:hypothetical protein
LVAQEQKEKADAEQRHLAAAKAIKRQKLDENKQVMRSIRLTDR